MFFIHELLTMPKIIVCCFENKLQTDINLELLNAGKAKSQSEAQNKEEMMRVEKSCEMINSKERSLSYNFLILKASE